MNSLEAALGDIAHLIEYPQTPPLTDGVLRSIESRGRSKPFLRLRAVWVAAVMLVALVLASSLVLILSPGARKAVADFLGVRGIRVFFQDNDILPSPDYVDGELSLSLGTRMTLEQAAARAEFDALTPELLGPPHGVYFQEPPIGGQIAFVYRRQPGHAPTADILIIQFRGSSDASYYGKLVGTGTSVEAVQINGRAGLWISGSPHLFFKDARGRDLRQEVRLAANVLLWDLHGITYRIEGEIPKEEALRIAVSMR